MSAISFDTDTLGLVMADASASKLLLDRLTQQASSGRVARSYGGLSRLAASTTLTLRPVLQGQKALRDGIDATQGRLGVTQSAMKGISQVASDFYAKIANLDGLNASQVDSIAANARDAMRQVASLLNTQQNGVYVFAGDDGANPPVPNPNGIAESDFATRIKSAVAGLGANGAAATADATLAIAADNTASPFSAAITSGTALAPVVVSGEGQTVTVGVLAGANGAVASLGSSTTGSYTRDILRALATLGALSSSQLSDEGFQALSSDTYASLGAAITALNQDAGVLGDRQTALEQTKATSSEISTALGTQLTGAEQVDMTSTLSQLTQAQTQLESSYRVIAALQSLSLTKFLG